MQELFTRIFTRANYAIGFIIFLIILFLFSWNLIDPVSFDEAVGGFIRKMLTVFAYVIGIIIALWGLKYMILGPRKSGKSH